jgi:Glycosyltransferase like family 2
MFDSPVSSQPMLREPPRAAEPAVKSIHILLWWDYACFGLLTALTWAALAWCLAAWLTQVDWPEHAVLLGSLTLLLASNLSVQQCRWWSLLWMRRPLPRPARAGWRVGVATTFVPGAESLEMLEVTVQALLAMAYPHDTWVLDESDDARVQALCTRLGARHFSRKSLAHYQMARGRYQARSKHGNYNAWLAEHGFTHYDLLMNIDPDHVPASTFLLEVLGYFDDPKIGYVQVAQAYYNQAAGFIARGAAEETYAYYSVTQMASYGLGVPIVTGCHTTHRMTALQQVGGFAPHDADDLLITLWYRAAGWQGVYVPTILARGLTPVDWAGYLTQQRRWARSVLDIKFRVYPDLAERLPRREQVLGWLHGLYYLRGLTTGIGIGLLAYMLVSGSVPQFLTDGTVWRFVGLGMALQGTEFYRQRFFLGGWAEWGLHWRAGMLQLAKWPYLGLALLDVLRHRQPAYQLTPKVRTAVKPHLVMRAHLPIVMLLGLTWLIGVAARRPLPGLLHLWTAGLELTSIALIATEWWPFPAPYDRPLWESQARGGESPRGPHAWKGEPASGAGQSPGT